MKQDTLHTTREVGEAIQKALPSFETVMYWRHVYINDETDMTVGDGWVLFPHVKLVGIVEVPAPTLHETLIAIRELGRVRGWEKLRIKTNIRRAESSVVGSDGYEKGDWVFTPMYVDAAKHCQHTLLDTLIAADLDLSHPSVSEYLIRIFNEK